MHKSEKNQKKVLTKGEECGKLIQLSQESGEIISPQAQQKNKIFLKKVLTNERVCGILKKLLIRAASLYIEK